MMRRRMGATVINPMKTIQVLGSGTAAGTTSPFRTWASRFRLGFKVDVLELIWRNFSRSLTPLCVNWVNGAELALSRRDSSFTVVLAVPAALSKVEPELARRGKNSTR